MSFSRVSFFATLAAASLMAAACNPSAPNDTAAEAPAAFVAAAGEPQVLAPLTDDDASVGAALGVVQLDNIPNQTGSAVRVFGMGGSDPAANGLRTYLAFVTPHDGKEFFLGDFYQYRVIGTAPGRIDLEVDEHIGNESGELAERTRRIIVSWTEMAEQDSPNPEFPSAVTLTPAE